MLYEWKAYEIRHPRFSFSKSLNEYWLPPPRSAPEGRSTRGHPQGIRHGPPTPADLPELSFLRRRRGIGSAIYYPESVQFGTVSGHTLLGGCQLPMAVHRPAA